MIMKQLFLKSVLFLAILILVKIPVFLFYQDEPMYRKSELAKEEFNTVFIGSSRTKYSIIPAYFDSLTKEKTKSYNFGVDYGVTPKTFFWCEDLIHENPSLKYVFFELSSGVNQVETFRETWREFYAVEYAQAVKNLKVRDSIKYHDRLVAGFFRLSSSTKNLAGYNIPLKDFLGKELKAKTITSQKVIRESHQLNLQAEDENYSTNSFNEFYWGRVSRLIELAESKQIRIYFFIPPRLQTEEELKTIYPIYRSLDKKYKLSVKHYSQLFYQDETSIDDVHLNHKGAMLFTKDMAEAFRASGGVR